MTRRIGAALIGLAVLLPAFGAAAAPASAHGSEPFTFDWGTLTTVDGTHVVGYVMNHTTARQQIQVTATWMDGTEVVASETTTAMLSNVAPHTASPFALFETDDVEGATLDLSAGPMPLGARPAGALSVELGEFTDTNVYEGEITNLSSTDTAAGVVVYANRWDGSYTGAAASAVIPMINPGETATYEITFDDESSGDVVLNLVAETTTSTYLTSWNNYFRDLANSLFFSEIAWMADEGITSGCGDTRFCPKDFVTRAQMAVFLDRALDLPDAGDQGFTDLAGQPATFVQAINNLAAAGITSGCKAAPKQYCPTAPVTRGQMSVFVVIGYRDWGNKLIDVVTNPSPDPFSDDNGQFHEDYNNALHATAISSGCGVGTYCPNSPILREQMAAFLLRASQLDDAS